jgi:hypothetical protein
LSPHSTFSEGSIAAMTKWLRTVPIEIPDGYVLVHNMGRRLPRGLGLPMRGFRAWIARPGNPDFEVCDCPFAPDIPGHYRIPNQPQRED